jgi:hypothetical protein
MSVGGRQLLLNVTKDGGPLLPQPKFLEDFRESLAVGRPHRTDVVLLDLASGQTTTKSTSGLPVFGWVRDPRKK